jgi:hypothetical protein
MAHLYQADLTLQPDASVSSISITPTDPSVRLELYGIAAIDTSEAIYSLDLSNRDGLQRLSDVVIQNAHALPRAFVLPMTQAYSPARHPALTATQLVASPDHDVHTRVLIENDPNTPPTPSGSLPVAPATRIEDLAPDAIRITASATSPSYLVLDDFYHRGWTARVDGQPSRVFIANAVFRAVAIDAGTHVVEFRFEPLSHLMGAAISAISLLMAALVIVWGVRGRSTR